MITTLTLDQDVVEIPDVDGCGWRHFEIADMATLTIKGPRDEVLDRYRVELERLDEST